MSTKDKTHHHNNHHKSRDAAPQAHPLLQLFGDTAAHAPAPADDDTQPPSTPGIGERLAQLGIDGVDQEIQNVPIRLPDIVELEHKLGAPDAVGPCYICDVADTSDPTRIDEKVSRLLMYIALKRSECYSDMKGLASAIKIKFDNEIRNPQNALIAMRNRRHASEHPNTARMATQPDDASDEESSQRMSDGEDDEEDDGGVIAPIAEWTLWSIYLHLTQHDKSPEAQDDRMANQLEQYTYAVFNNGVFVADSKVKNPNQRDARADVRASTMWLAGCTKLHAINIVRAKRRAALLQALSTGAAAPIGATPAAAVAAAPAGGVSGKRGAGPLTMAAALGSAASSISAIQKKGGSSSATHKTSWI
jgi:hypothetical protein